jgi:hypothetical protein
VRQIVAIVTLIVLAVLAPGCGAVSRAVETRGGLRAKDAYQVLLFPEVNAGWAGWCFFATADVPGDGGCAGAQHYAPVIDETWSGGESPPETVGVALTTDAVARVEITEGISVPTHTEKSLPKGLRAAVIKVSGRDLMGSHVHRPRFIPVNSSGAVIPQAPSETASELLRAIPTRTVPHPADPAPGICEITMRAHPGLTADSGSVITEVHNYAGFVGSGFISCASTSYELAGWPLLASVLISAAHPGGWAPPLSSMKPVPGHLGVFATLAAGGSEPENELYARRSHGGWLVVGGGKASQRLELLGDLRASIHA